MCSSDLIFFFFKQKTAYEIYQCDWSSDVCSSDLSQENRPTAMIGQDSRMVAVKRMARQLGLRVPEDRSEERRVGKERRSRWSPYH